MRGLTLIAACALTGCQFRVDGSSATAADASVTADLAPPATNDLPADLAPPAAVPDLAPPPDLTPPSELFVTSTPMSGTIDLTQVGTIDWAHYGFSSATSFDDKATGGQRISTLTALPNSGAQMQSTATAMQYSWSDGATGAGHQMTATSSNTDVFVSNGGQTLHVPAGVNARRLIVYVAVLSASARFDVSLSDNSQPPFSSTQSPTDAIDHGFAYTIDFAANSPGQTLTVSWSLVTPTSTTSFGVGVGAAALTTPPGK